MKDQCNVQCSIERYLSIENTVEYSKVEEKVFIFEDGLFNLPNENKHSCNKVDIHFGRSKKFCKENGFLLSDDEEVSKEHVKLFFESINSKINIRLVDLGSRNGTFVNNCRLSNNESRALSNGDRIRIGKSLFIVKTRKVETSTVVKQSTESKSTTSNSIFSDIKAFKIDTRHSTVENDFDFAPISHISTVINNCAVCNALLSGVSIMDQQIHINACLDKQTAMRGKKKKITWKAPKTIEQEHVHLALAISASSVRQKNPSKRRRWSELKVKINEIDAAIEKLQRKRKNLMKELDDCGRNILSSGTPVNEDVLIHVCFPRSREMKNEKVDKQISRSKWKLNTTPLWRMASYSNESSSYYIEMIQNYASCCDLAKSMSEKDVEPLDILLLEYESYDYKKVTRYPNKRRLSL